jgi:DNA-binding NarL/FixJ family response regulator
LASIRLLIIDPHSASTRGLLGALEAASDIEVAATAQGVDEGIILGQELRPDVVVHSVSGTNFDAAGSTRALRRALPDAGILMLAPAGFSAGAAIAAGAAGFVAKSEPVSFIVTAITAVGRGKSVIGRDIGGRGPRRGPSAKMSEQALTAREWEVLQLLAEGFNAAQIAEQLFISRNTARNYVQNVLGKLGAHSKLEAVAVARRSGLLAS